MVNKIISAISEAVYNEFGAEYKIYKENVEQGLKEPCFFIFATNPNVEKFLNNRYKLSNLFCVHYFPTANRPQEECNSVSSKLFSCLEYIEVDGDLLAGTGMTCESSDGVLLFFVNYDFFVYKKSDEDNGMDGVTVQGTVKGEDDG